MPVYEVRIDPLEPVLFGDNRSARAGFDHLQQDQDPSPLTIHGAIGRYLERCNGNNWPDELLGKIRPDVLAPAQKIAALLGFCFHAAGGNRLFPRPRHLRCELSRGLPRPADLVTPRATDHTASSVPWTRLLFPGDDEPLADEAEGELLLRESALADVLCGEVPSGGAELPSFLFRPEPRPGIAVDNDAGTVFSGLFFTRPYRRFQPPSCSQGARTAPAGFTSWLETLAPVKLALSDKIGFLGGDRRRAHFEIDRCDEPLADLREQVAEAAAQTASHGFLLYLLSPALQTESRIEAAGMPAVAAALGKPLHASGWDVEAKRPREIRALIPAGSVYFFDWPPEMSMGPPRAELVRRLWLHPLHEPGAKAGFGRCLAGIWR